ncbi:MAG: DUF4062 domain-containing protein [Verrucomicrobia bacterium]|nr:DUF4062 domain-containing protein [Verrucomicrobiota bacterium]
MPRVFISCVTAEFGAYRTEIARIFRRADWEVKIQEEFRQVPEDTIQKLSDYIRSCDVVIHLIGEGVGAMADPRSVAAFLRNFPDYLTTMKEVEDFATVEISYTQWELFLAIYHNKSIYVYHASQPIRDGNPTIACGMDRDWPLFEPQIGEDELAKKHLSRLSRLNRKIYPSSFKEKSELYGLFFGDFRQPLALNTYAVHELQSRFGPGKVDELRHILRTEAAQLLDERFLLAAYVQITSACPEHVSDKSVGDLALLDILAERKSPHVLLGLVKACEIRSRSLGLHALAASLDAWLASVLNAVQLSLAAVMGRCAETFDLLESGGLPRPSLEIAWKHGAEESGAVARVEAYLRWGRYRQPIPICDTPALTFEEAPTRLARRVRSAKPFKYIPFERLEIFVCRHELNQPWEYLFCSKPGDEEISLLPWPSVLRLLDRDVCRPRPKAAADPFSRAQVACHLGPNASFRTDVIKFGAFFAIPNATHGVHEAFHQVAESASLGFWMRNPHPPDLAEVCLEFLEDHSLAELPKMIFETKSGSSKGSPWRDLAVLYDPPDWPEFEFAEDAFDLAHHTHLLHALS